MHLKKSIEQLEASLNSVIGHQLYFYLGDAPTNAETMNLGAYKLDQSVLM